MQNEALTRDSFLGGRLSLWQPAKGYRAGIDPVLLAASIPARSGDSVLDLGCGAGAALFCLAARVPGLSLSGVELQPDYAALCVRNAAENALDADIFNCDINQMPVDLRQRKFTHVMANPPYFDRARSTAAEDIGRETALGDTLPIADWVQAAARRTAQRGTVTFIQRAERLPELMSAALPCLGSLELLPIVSRRGRPARLVLLRGRKGGRAGFVCHDAWCLHDGDQHLRDGESYTKETNDILRNGRTLPFNRQFR